MAFNVRIIYARNLNLGVPKLPKGGNKLILKAMPKMILLLCLRELYDNLWVCINIVVEKTTGYLRKGCGVNPQPKIQHIYQPTVDTYIRIHVRYVICNLYRLPCTTLPMRAGDCGWGFAGTVQTLMESQFKPDFPSDYFPSPAQVAL